MDYESPLVSIGMPVYNSERTIVRALDSLLAQNYPNFEIIVSDNSSTDKTAVICKAYAERDERIQLNINEKNLGIDENVRIVCMKAVGKYFMWAAGDDFWEPDFIKTLVNELEVDPCFGVALCAVKREYSDEKLKDIIRYDDKYNPNKLSNLQVAANLLTRNKEIRQRKFNLFVCGLFNYEALSEILDIEDNIFMYGERAFLSLIALASRFRFVDKVLFVKTVYQEPFKQRNPEEMIMQYRKDMKYYQYHYYYKIMLWITKSSKIPLKSKLFVFVTLYYIAYMFISDRKKKFYKQKKKFLKFFHK